MKKPRILFAAVLAAVISILGHAAEPVPQMEKTTVKLVSGETMTGTVGSIRDGSFSLITDYGPVRIPVDKLTAESRTRLGVTDKVDVAALQKRISELEDLVARLREENANLRKAATPVAPVSPQPYVSPGASSGIRGGGTPTVEPSASGGGYRISSTGKRHNSRCRYFTSKGRACPSNEGVACKICGG